VARRSADRPARGGKAQKAERAGAVRLTDPRAIRALAHPARLVMIDALYGGEELTATQAGELTGLSASAASYHLRALEGFGVVRRAAVGGDGRQRPWQAVGEFLEVDSLGAGGAVLTESIQTLLDRDRAAVATFLAGREGEPAAWRDSLSLLSTRLWLTPAEADDIVQQVIALVDSYRPRTTAAKRPKGSRPVRVALTVVPLE
jgi:DNA-binding transcriptional ArsR family regulator